MSWGLNLMSLVSLGVEFDELDEFGGCFLVCLLTSGVCLVSLGVLLVSLGVRFW